MKIGTLLRKLRDSKSLTTRDIATRIGISLSTYIDWEHDKTAPSLKLYIKLANAFEVSPVELMSYLTGQANKLFSREEKLSIAELRDMVDFLKINNNILLENNLLVVKELQQIKELIQKKSVK